MASAGNGAHADRRYDPWVCGSVRLLCSVLLLTTVDQRAEALEGLGSRHVPNPEDALRQRRCFVKPSRGPALSHIRAVNQGDPVWRAHLAFRDVLHSDARLFEEERARKLR